MNIFRSKLFIGAVSFVLGIGVVLLAQRIQLKPTPKAPHEDEITTPTLNALSAMQNAQAQPQAVPPTPQSQMKMPNLAALPGMDSMLNQMMGGSFGQMEKQMQKMQEQMMQAMNGSFDEVDDEQSINRREDKDYVYYDIAVKDLGKDKLKVRVANGQISVSGQIEKKSEGDQGGAYFSSSYHRSFPVPPNVDPEKVQMIQGKDLLTLKFPKLTSHT